MTTEKVKVIIRERPVSDGNQSDSVIRHCEIVKNRIFVDDRPFTIGQVFNPRSGQNEVYGGIKHLIQKFLAGYSCNVMAYGQSGTGKSYTMGLQADNFENTSCGIVPRALKDIMEYAQDPKNHSSKFEMSFFEVYNEKVFDLLSDKTDEPVNSKGSKFPGGVKRPLNNFLDAELILIEGNKNRHTRPTTINMNSSRSHGIVVIYFTTKNSSSTFHMVDLAGSEGVRRTGHKGEALTEGSHINRGLLGIGKICKALSDGNGWIPYRDTVMGSVLQDSLNVNGFSMLVICISGLKKDLSETMNSLSFAQEAMNWKMNPKIVPLHNSLLGDSKKKLTYKRDESIKTANQECLETPIAMKRPLAANFETPITMKRPLAASTAVTSRAQPRPNPNKFTEMQTPIPLRNILDLENSRLMDSPTVKQCFEDMKRTLQKRNYRINSINFSQVDSPSSDSDEMNSTVIPNLRCEANEVRVPVADANTVSEAAIPSNYMTREECYRLIETKFANLKKPIPKSLRIPNGNDITLGDGASSTAQQSFAFKVPELPVSVPISNDRRRSVRLQQRKSIVSQLPSPLPPPPPQPIKRRRTTITKKAARQSTIGVSVSKADHRTSVLDLLNKGDMKAIQVLPQIGMKTAYSIITHRSLNGKFKSFKDVAKAPFWRGKGWERFEMANNLC